MNSEFTYISCKAEARVRSLHRDFARGQGNWAVFTWHPKIKMPTKGFSTSSFRGPTLQDRIGDVRKQAVSSVFFFASFLFALILKTYVILDID